MVVDWIEMVGCGVIDGIVFVVLFVFVDYE